MFFRNPLQIKIFIYKSINIVIYLLDHPLGEGYFTNKMEVLVLHNIACLFNIVVNLGPL